MTAATTILQPRAFVKILDERCKACELCVVTCPQGNLKFSTKLNRAGFHPVEFSYRGTKGECTGCAICYWVCPDFAISEIQVKA
ncbi:MAG: 4Fe-4S dicluster domain-containing protein [Candidatus Bathyarchaeia archaeon]|jgi:2-oxoglutarate ferredoxin oxidoreductase subunit delta